MLFFDGESLAQQEVVLVGANYRLGVFGFFAHPELTAESPHHASGSYGLMALKWVRENWTLRRRCPECYHFRRVGGFA
jgi:para-nitrobenzyl esterase